MRHLRPVRWKEGMFLRPHHFQQQELYLASREACRLNALDPDAWGLVHVDIDEDALTNFSLHVRSLRLVFRDGTLVDVPGNALLPSKPFESLRSEAGRALSVSVGLRVAEDGRPQTQAAVDGQSRFSPHPGEVYDVDQGHDPAPIEFLDYNLRFFFDQEPTDGYEVIPFAQLEKTGNPARPVGISQDTAPPSMTLSASLALHETARSVVDILAGRLRTLEESSLATDDPKDIILFQILSSSMPVLEDMTGDGSVHPRRAYQELARLAGALYYRDVTSRSLDEIPKYDHASPALVFSNLRNLIDRWSEKETEKKFHRSNMQRGDGDRFSTNLIPEAKMPGSRCLLEVEAAESAPRVRTMMLGARISSPQRMEFLVNHAILGVGNELMAGQPSELPVGQTARYFRLKQEDDEWTSHVIVADQLVVQLLNAPQDVRVNLIVIPPRG